MAGIDGGGAPAPMATNIVTVGTISGFGSIIVNDVRYTTTNATITVDGVPGTEADLAVGKVVVVRGTLDSGGTTGVAQSIDSDDLIEGPVSVVDTVNGTLTIVGQTVQTDANTSFDPSIPTASLDGLNVNDFVEVAGFVLADGSVRATRITLEPGGGDIEVTGTVSNLGATTFQINGLVVDYSSAMLEEFPAGGLADGQRVEAEGALLGGAGELIATRVEFEDTIFDDDDIDQFEVEGFVTRFVSATDFDLEGIPVTTTPQTEFEQGSVGDLMLSSKIEVEGAFNASGVLVATKVEFEPEVGLEVASLVESVQTDRITVLGLDVVVNSSTRLEDSSSADLEPFNLGDINVGDYVDVAAFDNGNGEFVATSLEREDFDDEVSLQGTVDLVTDPTSFRIFGVLVQTNAGTAFEDANEMPITAGDFFAQALGITVKADGALLNGSIVADEVEIEN